MAATTKAPAPLVVLAVLAIVLLGVQHVAAKRGCSAFGHSCFGGHGKRADEDVMLVPGTESEQNRAVYDSVPSSLTDEDERALANALGNLMAPQQESLPLQLSPFLRQWLQSYRRPSGQSIEVK